MKGRKYHGWIYIEKSDGLKDHFAVQWSTEKHGPLNRQFGYGELGAAAAVGSLRDHLEAWAGQVREDSIRAAGLHDLAAPPNL